MKIALFLGAGASVPFKMPTTAQLREKLEDYRPPDLDAEILQSFIRNPKYPDIEYILQAVKDIEKFSTSKGGDYFFTQGKHGIFSYDKGSVPFETFVSKIKKVEEKLVTAIYDNYGWNPDNELPLLAIYLKIFEFLKKHAETVSIFTTNYDRCIEEFCQIRNEYRCTDGFVRVPPHTELSIWEDAYDDIDKSKEITDVYLYKLHGSLNWKEHRRYGIVKTNEESISSDSKFVRNLVVLPTLSPKEEEEERPFNEIIMRFKKYMQDADACIVIGFSFRDSVINDVFDSFVAKGKPLIVISPSSMQNVCENLLKTDVPKNFNPDKVSSLAPGVGNVWCLPAPINENNIQTQLDVTWVHIESVQKSRKN